MTKLPESSLETYFSAYRKNIIGIDQEFEGPYGKKKIVSADWTASGRMYEVIEKELREKLSSSRGFRIPNSTLSNRDAVTLM